MSKGFGLEILDTAEAPSYLSKAVLRTFFKAAANIIGATTPSNFTLAMQTFTLTLISIHCRYITKCTNSSITLCVHLRLKLYVLLLNPLLLE